MTEKPFLKVQSTIPGEWRVLHASQAFLSLSQYDWEILKGNCIQKLWGKVGQKIGKFLSCVSTSGLPDTAEYWLEVPKGVRCYRLVAAPTHGGIIVITMSDLTDERLVQNLDQLLALETKQVLWAMTLPDLRMDYVSASITPLFGYSQVEMTQDPYRWQHITHIDDRELVRQSIETVLRVGQYTIEHRIVLDNGEIRWIRNKLYVARDDEGKPARIVGALTDITGERNLYNSREEQSVFHLVVNEQMDPVLRYKPDLMVTFCNASYAALYSKKPEDLVGTSMQSFVNPQEIQAIRDATDELLENGLSLQTELPKILPDGTVRWYRWTDILTVNPDSGEQEIQTVGHDISKQKETEIALKESRTRFSLATIGMNDGIWDWDFNKGEIWFSARFKEQLGFDDEHLKGPDTLKELMDPDDYLATEEQIEQLRKGNIDRLDIVQRYRHKKGHIIHIHCRAVGDRNETGELVRLVGANTEVTRIIQAESRLRDAIEVISDGFVLFDPDDRVVLHNEQFLYTPALKEMSANLIGVTFREIAEKFAKAAVTDVAALSSPEAWIAWRIARHENPPSEGYEQQLTDGRWLRIIERRTAEGGYVGIWTDITALKQAEIRLRIAIESINEGFMLLDDNMKVVMCNDRLRQLYPISGALLKPGASLKEVLRYAAAHGEYPGIENVDAFVEESMQILRPERPIVYERALADGRWVLASQRRTSNGDIVGVRTDITSQKQREAELNAARNAADQANAAKSRFLAHMSHELRTPLNAILGFTDVMRKGVFGEVVEPRYKQYLGFIYDSGHHLLSLINDILDISKVEAGRRELYVERIDIAGLCDACMQVVATQALTRNVQVRHVIGGEGAFFFADLRAMKQIIINLLSNAVKFTPAGGKVILSVNVRDDQTVISIEDTGIGMDEADILKAFDPFGQIESDLARETEGTGLGLALVKSLVELHHGRIEVESAINFGTKITLIIPKNLKYEATNLPLISYRSTATASLT